MTNETIEFYPGAFTHTPVVGIDPGASGAACLIDWGRVIIHPFKGCPMKDPAVRNLPELLKGPVTIEKVGAMPSDGRASAFQFGFNTGAIIGVVLASGVEFVQVLPQVWQHTLGLDKRYSEIYIKERISNAAKKKQTRKSVNAMFAIEELAKFNFTVQGKITLQTADAVCIALYAWRKERGT